MTAYDLSEKKNKILNRIGWLKGETENNTGTVVLSNDEVNDVIDCLKDYVESINIQLSKVQV